MNTSIVPTIETERLVLRQASINDLEAWGNTIFADTDVIRYMPKRDMTPYARAERSLNLYNALWQKNIIGGWVVTDKVNNQLIGCCEIEYLDDTDEYELGYAFGKAFWGNGYATETTSAVVRYAFEHCKLERIIAVVVPENNASWRVLEHIGFVFEKKANYYDLDVMYYALTHDRFKLE